MGGCLPVAVAVTGLGCTDVVIDRDAINNAVGGERGLLALRRRGWWLLTVDVVAVAAAGVDCGGVGWL